MRAWPHLLLPLLAGCSAVSDHGRSAVLHEWLVRDNLVWADRDPDLVANKLSRMAADPYDFMRGTAGLYHADLARLSVDHASTDFLNDAEALQVLVAGDPHPENVGSAAWVDRPSRPTPVALINDLDAATWGPWYSDVRRAAVGVGVLAWVTPGCDEACELSSIDAMVTSYERTMRSVDGGIALPHPGLQALLDKAVLHDAQRRRFERFTRNRGNARVLIKQTVLASNGEGVLELTDDERATFDEVVPLWLVDRPGVRIIDVGRRFGQGVSSLPALRFLVLVDEGRPTAIDDRLVTLREVVNAPLLPGPVSGTFMPFQTNAERLHAAAEALLPTADADPEFAVFDVGDRSYKAKSYGSLYRSFDHLDLHDEPERVPQVAEGVGHVLASAHRGSITALGGPARPVILRDLGSGDLSAEVVPRARRDVQRYQRDHELFLGLLRRHGEDLGSVVW